MGKADHFHVRAEGDPMLANDTAGTSHGKADRAGFALRIRPVIRRAPKGPEVRAAAGSSSIAEHQCRSRRGIHLAAVMRLEDFDVPVLAEALRRAPGQLAEQVHAEREIAGFHDRHLFAGLCDLGFLAAIKPGRADHGGFHALAFQDGQRGERGLRRGKVDPDIGAFRGFGGVFHRQHAHLRCVEDRADILAKVRRARRFARSADAMTCRQRRARNLLAHSSGNPGNRDVQRRTHTACLKRF